MTDKKLLWSPPQIIWSALIAIVVWSGVGFSWFGYGFNWQTEGNAKQMSATAVMESLATICVAQARSGPDADAALKQLAELSTWKQRAYIETANWATMPGNDSAQSGVAELCATKLRQT